MAKYDFTYSSVNVGLIITASSIRGANVILNRTVKDPGKFTLKHAVDSNGCNVDLKKVK